MIDVPAAQDGVIAAIDTRAVGYAVVKLGGGRTAPDQAVDPSVGFDRLLPLGSDRPEGRPDRACPRVSSRAAADAAAAALSAAFSIGDRPPKPRPLIERI